jgi:AraC-like DNA-binding protein
MLLWIEGPRLVGDDSFGLHVAEVVHAGAIGLGIFDLVDYATRASATLGAAIDRLARYAELLQEELLEIRLESDGGRARLVAGFIGMPPGSLRHAAEFVIATFLLRARRLIGRDFPPLEVELQHAAPASLGEHRRLFGPVVRFDRPVNAVAFDAALLDRPVVSADDRLCALLDRQAADILARLPRAEAFTERVRRAIYDLAAGGAVSSERVAARLGVTARTLQRRLRDEGETYQALLDSVRCEIAQHHLVERRVAISEIAFLLGFADVPAFHRAFRRWTGDTPAQARLRGTARPRPRPAGR